MVSEEEKDTTPLNIYHGYIERGLSLIQAKTDLDKGVECIKIGLTNIMLHYGTEEAAEIMKKYNLGEFGFQFK